jgi:thioredoxin reductase
MSASDRRFVVVGGGPAGLTAAYELTKLGAQPIVLEKQPILGGLASTAQSEGYHFDMGGHRRARDCQEGPFQRNDGFGPAGIRGRAPFNRIQRHIRCAGPGRASIES